MKRYLYWLITFLIALYVAIFGVKNDAKVSLDLWPFGWQLKTSLSLLILIAFIVGIVVGGVIAWWTEWKKRLKEKHQYQAELKELIKNRQQESEQ